MTQEPNKDYKINKVGIGYGKRSDFTKTSITQTSPAPNKYNSHIKNSLSYISVSKNAPSEHGFYNNFDKYEKLMYRGQEQHFYMRETLGPGAYLN